MWQDVPLKDGHQKLCTHVAAFNGLPKQVRCTLLACQPARSCSDVLIP